MKNSPEFKSLHKRLKQLCEEWPIFHPERKGLGEYLYFIFFVFNLKLKLSYKTLLYMKIMKVSL
jgi:hypothetical protein